ncbi:MAG: OmpA family protein [Helicobacteraceae bacterium]|jgi:OOP family OmpA-OmpF porin|nr:OmpA family protein [Helicobacteraceae bacterium]
MKSTVIRATKTAGFLLLASFANPLMAQTTTDYSSGWYIGGNIGLSTTNIDEDKITQNLTNPSYSDDDKDLGYKLFGGYQFNKYFALEGGYFNLGKFDYAVSTSTGTLDGEIKVMGLNLDAVGILPITEDFSAFGRIGANYAQAKDSYSATGTLSVPDTSPEKTALNYKFGAGLQYAITDALGMRLEAERYRISDAVGNNGDIDLYSLGLTYRFGVKNEAAPVSEQEEVIAPAPKEEEVVVVVTEPEAEKKIIESVTEKKIVLIVFEDIHFQFDQSTLSEEAKGALKRDIAQLSENPKIKMLVAGYTSESGTEKYNQGLSERRAQSVKDYLVEEKLISADKISVIGYGETRPTKYEATPSHVYTKAAKANMRAYIKIIHE